MYTFKTMIIIQTSLVMNRSQNKLAITVEKNSNNISKVFEKLVLAWDKYT